MTATLQLYDDMRPGLGAGTYTVEAEHTVDVDGAEIPPGRKSFAVQGPRFTLPAGEVHSVYPPANAVGPFAETLAHVVLDTRTLPWERELMGPRVRAPWLALLVFDAGEIAAAGPTAPTGAVSSTVDALLTSEDGVIVPHIAVTGDERKLPCQTLEIPLALFQAVAPRASELRYLAHVRQLSLAGQPGAGADDVGWFAVVVASRLPAAAQDGARNIAHLVSVEGHEAQLPPAGPPHAQPGTIRLVSLASWSFSADTAPAGESFAELALALAAARPGERQDLALGLPFDAGAPDGRRKQVADRLADGYVPIAHRAAGGEEAVAWYRGPLVPRPAPRLAGSPHPFPTSAAALARDEATGMLDVSLAAAWEIGRAMALADRKFTIDLVRFRRGAHRLVDLVLAGLQSAHLDTPDDLAAIAKSGLVEQRFIDRLKAGLAGTVAAVSSGATARPGGPGPTGNVLPHDPVAAVKALLDRDDLQALVADEVTGDLTPIAGWLAQLMLLHGIPFAYLAPHPQLLPVESMRFFHVDRNWIETLVDGAVSVGVQSSRDSWFQQLVRGIGPEAAGAFAPAPVSGFLLRSALVAGWPALTVDASATAGTQPAILRSERLAPDVLLCLFAGVPDQVRLRTPQQSLHFALEGNEVHPRQLTAPIGTLVGSPIPVDAALHRAGAGRVLDVTALVGSIGAALGTPIGSADLALQLLDAPEEMSFTRP
jgi:hypothetical protein